MEENKNQIIKIKDENGIERDAEVLTVFEMENTGKNYCVYSIKKEDDENILILASAIEKDEKGFDVLKDITNPEEKKVIYNIINDIVKNV